MSSNPNKVKDALIIDLEYVLDNIDTYDETSINALAWAVQLVLDGNNRTESLSSMNELSVKYNNALDTMLDAFSELREKLDELLDESEGRAF